MTWSIIALDEASGALGTIVVSRFLALGSLGPHGCGGLGLVVTQAMADPMSGAQALRLVAEECETARIPERALGAGPAGAARQLHMIDAGGRVAAHSDEGCEPWYGQASGRCVSVAGNGLPGPAVLEATLEAFERSGDSRFGARLLRAMQAGEAVSGKTDERRTAVLRIYGDHPFPLLDLRVDDHRDALNRLAAIYVSGADDCIRFAGAVCSGSHPRDVAADAVFARPQPGKPVAYRARASAAGRFSRI